MDYANEFPVRKMCSVLKVSRSGYYKWLLNKDSSERKKETLDNMIEEVFNKSRKTYGSPRVHISLCRMDIKVSVRTVARRMKKLKISPVSKKRFRNTTDSKHSLAISPNLLDREFSVSELGKFWVGDITYIRLRHSFVYLTTVIDLADRMVIGWNLSDNMTDRDTTMAAFNRAVKNRPPSSGLVFHSDRGSQYASKDFRKLLLDEKCTQSMSRKGNCWDNAVAESFFKTIKCEELYRHEFENMGEVYSVVFDYIDGWYNTKRIHSTLEGKSPREMSILLTAKMAA